MKISVVITTWNSQKTLKQTLSSVAWADEIIVVDGTSSDKSAEIAKKAKAAVFVRPNNPMLNVNKNFGFENASGDWILSLDADEEIPADLAREIQKKIKRKDVAGYWIPRKNIQFGKWVQHGIWWPDPQLRLFQKGKGAFPQKHVHEYLAVEGKTETLEAAMVHYNYSSISQFIRKMDTLYTPSEVAKHQAAGYRVSWQDAIRFPVSEFVKLYFAQGMYKDGLHGLVLAGLQSVYSFVVFAKLWEEEGFPDQRPDLSSVSREFAGTKREVSYWMQSAVIENERNPLKKIILKVKRRL